jgi:hypothetical protein
MRPSAIVEIEIFSDRRPRLANAVIGLEIDLLVFNRPPETLDEDVVAPGGLAIHADPDLPVEKNLGEVMAGELAALVGVEDFGLAVFRQRLLDGFDAEGRIHGDRQPPCQNLA